VEQAASTAPPSANMHIANSFVVAPRPVNAFQNSSSLEINVSSKITMRPKRRAHSQITHAL
jgi:hypothetical protein